MRLFNADRVIRDTEEEIRIEDTVRAFRNWVKRRKLTRDGKPLSDADLRDIGIMIAYSFVEPDSDCPHCEVRHAAQVIWKKFVTDVQSELLNN